ncbi:MAG: phosphoglucosamine mutase [Dissulfurispiraceae bacterium]|jgi:phosphoglucosamine mutase
MKLFGTDGIRGKVNRSPMTPENVLRVGMATASVLRDDHGRHQILIGKDTRISGYLIESALTAGICSMGMDVTLVGPIPTPGIAFLTRALRLDAGVAISASHNPFEDNGIKIFSSSGFKLSDDIEKEIERLVQDESFPLKKPTGDRIGKAFRLDDAAGRYIEYVKSSIPRGIDLDGLKVVVDSANGAAYKITSNLLHELGAEVISINDDPDGVNINLNCGSMHLDQLSQRVKENGAHVGIAHDGDADRTLFIDDKGNTVDGDLVMGICAPEMSREGRLKGDSVVATVMSNLGLEKYLAGIGIKLIRTKVGDRYVVEEMIRGGYNLGGEQSGHMIFFDYNTTGDGPITALQLLYLMRKKNRLLSEMTADIYMYPQVLKNVTVVKGKNYKDHLDVVKVIDDCTRKLGDKGRILVRPSGTEPMIRVMVEGEEYGFTKAMADEITAVIQKRMGIKK